MYMESQTISYIQIFDCVEGCTPTPKLFRVNCIQFFGIKYTYIVVQPSSPSISRIFHLPKLKLYTNYTKKSTPLSPSSWHPVSMDLTTPDTSYKWNHCIFVLL